MKTFLFRFVFKQRGMFQKRTWFSALHTRELAAEKRKTAQGMARVPSTASETPSSPSAPPSLHKVLVQDPSLVCHLAHPGATDARQQLGRIWTRSCAFSPRTPPAALGTWPGSSAPPAALCPGDLPSLHLMALHLTSSPRLHLPIFFGINGVHDGTRELLRITPAPQLQTRPPF